MPITLKKEALSTPTADVKSHSLMSAAWKVASVKMVWRNEAPSSSALVKSAMFILRDVRVELEVNLSGSYDLDAST